MSGGAQAGPEISTQYVSQEADTLPKLLRRNYLTNPNKRAMSVKDQGIWISYTWKDYYENVKYFSLGLMSLGFKRGDIVSIIGENKPEYFWAELAVHAAGGVVSGLFVDCAPQELKYFVQAADSTFAVAHDQEQVDKFMEIKDELPLLKKVIYWDPKGLWAYDDPLLMSFEAVQDLGREYEKDHPHHFEEGIEQGKIDDLAIISWTSGTTGLPKGAMLTHMWLVKNVVDWAQLDGWFGKNYEYVSFIPPAWGTEQLVGIAGGLLTDLVVNFPEKPETVQEDIRIIGPHILFYGVRQWESVNRVVQARMIDSTFLRRLLYKTFLPIGLKMADIHIARKKPGLWWRILYFIAYHAIFRQLRARLGMSRVRLAYSGGASLSPAMIRYFKALGIEIKMGYGGTEMGLVSSPWGGELRPETAGRPYPWVDVKISEEGEILVKNKYMYTGYYKNPEATRKSLDADGYYKSGDFGYLDESGHLIVIDRMDHLKKLAGGKKFSPQFIEVRLRFSPYIKDAIAVGSEERDFVSVLVNIDIENMGRFADARRINYTTFTDLSQKPEVIELVRKEIAQVNRTLPEEAQVRRFVNLHKEFDADEAELTRTQKLRRTFIEEKYKDMIDALYGERGELTVEAQVTYRDGRTARIKTQIKVNRLEG